MAIELNNVDEYCSRDYYDAKINHGFSYRILPEKEVQTENV